ncbi:uracil-DNA glycosylase [Paenalcaligenes niemegkensis]|uniref:uracil-DNA glycosylase n=1 Tax=Paenalcaligenes niemegkensis TaxID=2895469 RepID=UPI001EE7B0E8|nr:uracil-DNA glycosylase [Paenalcaligenes niemegkensis]MCQ9617609.1 uracil-DNA glycosylase [Paenalcaligenes niemegkensis]
MSVSHTDQQLALMDTPPQNSLAQSVVSQAQDLTISWRPVFEDNDVQGSLKLLNHWLDQRKKTGAIIYPSHPFKALELIAPEDVKVVILGQDPYHGPEQAQGLSFSVPDTVRCPPSLRNIFKELAREYPDQNDQPSSDLTRWATQGVLLLNTSLTVENAKAGSHAGKGWEPITDAVIAHLFKFETPKVFMLWGAHAQAKQKLIDSSTKHGPVLSLASNHPSPLSATKPPVPFIGNGHFRLANEWLESWNQTPIDW